MTKLHLGFLALAGLVHPLFQPLSAAAVEPLPIVAGRSQSEAVKAGWEPISDADDIHVYRKEIEGSPVVAFRGEGPVEAPAWKVASVVLDDDRAADWVDSLKESKLLKQLGPMEHIEYNFIEMPFIIRNRDFVMKVDLEAVPAAGRLSVKFKSVEDPIMPPGRAVRGELINSRFELTALDGGKTYFVGEIHADPKGAIPKWIVNMFQKSWARDTFEGIRRQVKVDGLEKIKPYHDLVMSMQKW